MGTHVFHSGCIYSWDIKRLDEYTLRMGQPYIPHKHFQESLEITFYLAKSPVDELLVICVHGNEKMYYDPSGQVVLRENGNRRRYYAPLAPGESWSMCMIIFITSMQWQSTNLTMP
jgi:hypothetical protein